MMAAYLVMAAVAALSGAAAGAPDGLATTVQDTTRRGYFAEMGYVVEAFGRDRSAWQTGRMQIGRRHARGAVLGELFTSRRFDRWDQGAAVEIYHTIAPGWSGFARAQVTPGADVLPETDVQALLERALGGGWEAGVSYRRMGFADAAIDILGVTANRYVGLWLLTARGSIVPERGRTGASLVARARRWLYPDRPDGIVEITAGIGEEVVLLGAALPPDVRSTTSLEARIQHRLTGFWSVTGGASWNREERAPSRVGVTLALRRSW